MTRLPNAIPFIHMRGGTSKGVFLRREDVPQDRASLTALLLSLFGSPDARQIDGLGGADKLTSKAAIMGPPTHPDADVDYLFAQVGIGHAEVDYRLNCGNLTAAAAAYAVDEGFVPAAGDAAQVRIHNVNTRRIIVAGVPLCRGRAREDGDFAIDGVPGTGAPIGLDFAAATGAITGRLLPLGQARTRLAVPGLGEIDATVLDGPNLVVLVRAADLGMRGTETPQEIDRDTDLTARMTAIRQTVAERCGLGEYWHARAAPSTPMLVAVQKPLPYVAYTTGSSYAVDDYDLCCRQYSTAATSKALAATVTSCLGMACRIPGTLAHELVRARAVHEPIRIGHPSGLIGVQAEVHEESGSPAVRRAVIWRTARRLARGEAYLRP